MMLFSGCKVYITSNEVSLKQVEDILRVDVDQFLPLTQTQTIYHVYQTKSHIQALRNMALHHK